MDAAMEIISNANDSKALTSDWTKLVPKQITENYKSSVIFIKQLTTIAISTITYIKKILPETSYKAERFGGVEIQSLKKNCEDKSAQFVTKSLINCYDAFDKEYLHKLALCFYDGDYEAENLIECFSFEYTYNKDGVTMNIQTNSQESYKKQTKYTYESIRDRTLQLINTCMITTKKTNFNNKCNISFHLYYNENAPEDYQAPGYMPYLNDDILSQHKTFGSIFKIGFVETPHHSLRMRSFIKNTDVPEYARVFSPLGSGSVDSVQERQEPCLIKCSCLKNDDDFELLIHCFYCKTYQHASCYGIRRSDVEKVSRHCCVSCHEQNPNRELTDPGLIDLELRSRMSLCFLRRALDLCSQINIISLPELESKFGTNQTNVMKLMKVLISKGIIVKTSYTTGVESYRVVPKNLGKAINEHFQVNKFNIIEQLLFECLTPEQLSQETNVLPSTDKQNPITINQVMAENKADDTLEQFRNAIIVEKQESNKLPLSGSHNPISVENIGQKPIKRQSPNKQTKEVFKKPKIIWKK